MNPPNNFHYSNQEKILHDLDWNCSDQLHSKTSLSPLHWYPGTFIPSIPSNIIDIFSTEGDWVWDPFCGSGTSGVEAYRKGRNVLCSDINKIATTITKGKLSLLQNRNNIKSEHDNFERIIKSLIVSKNRSINEKEISFRKSTLTKVGRENCAYEELTPWYNPHVLIELVLLWGVIKNHSCSEGFRNIITVVFLNVAKVASAQQKTWGHIADNVKPKAQQINERTFSPIPAFISRVSSILLKSQKTIITSSNCSVLVECAKAQHLTPPNPVDLIVTSPPYPSMADYVTSQRLAYYWLNVNLKGVNDYKSNEIGARHKRRRKGQNQMYIAEMKSVMTNIISHLKTNGHLAMVLPEYVNTDERKLSIDYLVEFCSSLLQQKHTIIRQVDAKKRWSPFKSLETEKLVIWVKP